MKILAFAASNSRNSINRALVEYAAARLQSDILPGAETEFLDLNDFEMPIYSIERETKGGIPADRITRMMKGRDLFLTKYRKLFGQA